MKLKRARIVESDEETPFALSPEIPKKKLKTNTLSVESTEKLPIKKRPIPKSCEKENLVIVNTNDKTSPTKTGCDKNILKTVSRRETVNDTDSDESEKDEDNDDDDDLNDLFVTLKSKGLKTNFSKKSPNAGLKSPPTSTSATSAKVPDSKGKESVKPETRKTPKGNEIPKSLNDMQTTPTTKNGRKTPKTSEKIQDVVDSTPKFVNKNYNDLQTTPTTKNGRKTPKTSENIQDVVDSTPKFENKKYNDLQTTPTTKNGRRTPKTSEKLQDIADQTQKSAAKEEKRCDKKRKASAGSSPNLYEVNTKKQGKSSELTLHLKKTKRQQCEEKPQSTDDYMKDLCDKSPSELILNFKRTPKKKISLGDLDDDAPTPTRSVSPNKENATPKSSKSKRNSSRLTGSRRSILATPENQKGAAGRKSLLLDTNTPTSAYVPKTPTTPLERARVSLHVSAVPDSLPCREKEFSNVVRFLTNKLHSGLGGCMYISGVPGTGKTATVTQAVRHLQQQQDLPTFRYVEMNGMRLSDPRQAYVQLWQNLNDSTDKISAEQAQRKLDAWFNKSDRKRATTVVLVDELDLICTKKQDVVYNLLDWPTRTYSRLVVLAIANTMDMPERMLKGRVTSRLGLTRLMFLPYTHKQLEEIVQARLKETNSFDPDAVRLVTRKVAGVSGDARRALDICRRATELPAPDETVGICHIERAIKEMTNSNVVLMLRGLSELEKLFLRSVADVCTRSGLDEVSFLRVLEQFSAVAVLEGLMSPPLTEILTITHRLSCCRVVLSNPPLGGVLQKLMLNVTQDDVHYALRTPY